MVIATPRAPIAARRVEHAGVHPAFARRIRSPRGYRARLPALNAQRLVRVPRRPRTAAIAYDGVLVVVARHDRSTCGREPAYRAVEDPRSERTTRGNARQLRRARRRHRNRPRKLDRPGRRRNRPGYRACGSDTSSDSLRGDLLPDWDEDWIQFERERLRQLRVHALEALCRRLSECGRHEEAVDAGQATMAAEPLREAATHPHFRTSRRRQRVRSEAPVLDLPRSSVGQPAHPAIRGTPRPPRRTHLTGRRQFVETRAATFR